MHRRVCHKKILILPVFAIVITCLFFAQTPSAYSVVATIHVGCTECYGTTYDPVKGEIFVTDDGPGPISVYVISDTTNSVVATIPGDNTISAAYDSAKGEIFTVSGGVPGHVSVISDTTNSVVPFVGYSLLTYYELVQGSYDSAKGEIFFPVGGGQCRK